MEHNQEDLVVVEYDCEGCGVHVYGLGYAHIPKNHMCSGCGFIHWSVTEPKVREELLVHLGYMKPLELP